MIAVIADDFTGAAEIGGIGLKYGLKVRIETEVKSVSDVDLLIVATDTRSLKAEEASNEIKKITKKLVPLRPQFIYKKLDSVLRGNIADELVAQMISSNKSRSIIVAGNPFLGRRIRDGIYTIDSVPLNKTHFENDPDFPVKSSSAVDIIGRKAHKVFSLSVDDRLPEKGLIIGNVTDSDEMNKWALKIDETTIAAGGSGFFDVILSKQFVAKAEKQIGTVYTGDKTLLISGSTFPKSKEVFKWLNDFGIVTKNMPVEIYNNQDFNQKYFKSWVNEVVESLKNGEKVIISIEHNKSSEGGIAIRVKKIVARLVKEVMLRVELDDLFIEGGATTSEILGALKIAKLYPCRELAFGIIQMKVDEYPKLCITTKPGSYSWPKNISFNNVQVK
ncbi:hypothetical protein OU798_16605 [Prolixibacteraceae bacterium Z1-6]|uniref:Four-carbon acid sugar kinase family protein n=1 Tax=Draconibacterium aestuarii TaxID=2998507 RepID=A0A9X3J7H2_9BACT|nr:hypothetical protein [Prolixibacteraceae bacterium Z1-6]